MSTSMTGLLRRNLDADPDATLLIDAGVEAPLTVTRIGFARRVAGLRAELAARGVGPGGCVAVWLPNWSDALVWQFATVSLGAHVIGVNTRYGVEEVTHVLRLARPVVVAVAHGFLKLALRDRLLPALAAAAIPPPAVAVITGPHRAPATAAELAEYDTGGGAWAPAGADGDPAGLADEPDRLAVAFTTSGSTGHPKLAAHTVAAVAGHADSSATAAGFDTESVFACVLPLSGVFSFVPAMATIAAGGTVLLEPAFEPATIVRDMARHGATHLIGADDIVGRLIEAARDNGAGLPRWRRLLLADFNGRSEELAEWAERTLGLSAGGVYGSSELFALTSLWTGTEPLPRRWRGGGRPVSPAIRVRAADPDTGAVLPPGEAGELQFLGPNVVDAYLGEPWRRPTVLTPDGWFRSGDLGTVAVDGSFDYLCRAGDALRLKGFLVEPAEIENRLAAHPAVELTKVVGLRLPNGETAAVAFVLPRTGMPVAQAELQAWCATDLARYKVPRSVHVISAFPVTSGVNGTKVRGATLRDWAEAFERDPGFLPPSEQPA